MLGRPVVGWVGGGETVAERDHLAAFDTPGISVGSPVEGLGDSSNPTITPVPSSWSDRVGGIRLQTGDIDGAVTAFGEAVELALGFPAGHPYGGELRTYFGRKLTEVAGRLSSDHPQESRRCSELAARLGAT